MPPAVKIDDRHRIPALDGVRGLAVLMVTFFHFFARNDFTNFPLGRLLNFASHPGQTGVDLFFVLSGFLITGILLDARGTSHYFWNFYVRRVLRIFPLYYGALFFLFFLVPAISPRHWVPWSQQAWAWFYAINIHWTFFPGQQLRTLDHFWSLAVEEHFYLVWPAIVFLCNRRGLFTACIACIVISLLSRALLIWLGYSPYSLTPCRLDVLAAGALLALYVRKPKGFAGLTRLRPLIWVAVLFVLMLPLWISVSGSTNPVKVMAKFPLVAMMYAAVLASAIDPATPIIGRLFSNRVLTTLGKYSYGLYVWDWILNNLLGRWTSNAALGRYIHSDLLLLAVCLIVQLSTTFFAAILSWHCYEKHFLRLKPLFTARKNPRPAVCHTA